MKKYFIGITAALVSAVILTGCLQGTSSSEPEYEISSVTEVTEASEIPETEAETEPPTEPETDAEAEAPTEAETEAETFADYSDDTYVEYHFRTKKQLQQHFIKHGGEFDEGFGYADENDYEKGASDVINSSDALYKTEAEDGDGVYYIEATNEFVVLSTDGYIRTYFRPSSGKKYFDKQ